MTDHLFEKGKKKTGGRKKGSKNKATAHMKETIEMAFHELGGKEFLISVGKKDPKTFLALFGKLLPHELAGSVDVTVSLADMLEEADEPREDESD